MTEAVSGTNSELRQELLILNIIIGTIAVPIMGTLTAKGDRNKDRSGKEKSPKIFGCSCDDYKEIMGAFT